MRGQPPGTGPPRCACPLVGVPGRDMACSFCGSTEGGRRLPQAAGADRVRGARMPERPRLPQAAEPLSAEALAVCPAVAGSPGASWAVGHGPRLLEEWTGAWAACGGHWPWGRQLRGRHEDGGRRGVCVVGSRGRSRFRPEGSRGKRPVEQATAERAGRGAARGDAGSGAAAPVRVAGPGRGRNGRAGPPRGHCCRVAVGRGWRSRAHVEGAACGSRW